MMINLYPLFSSSSGNMYLIETENANVLIDIGVTYKKARESLEAIGKSTSDIDAIFITHEHSDHIKGLSMFIKSSPNVKVYSSIGTCEYLKDMLINSNVSTENLITISPDTNVEIKDLNITSFSISHDAIDPVGYNVSCGNKSITIATDLGVMTNNVLSYLENSSFPVIEANYDKNMLLAGKYPFEVKRRISGPYGHLSNEDSGQVILKLAKNGTRDFLLSHMSENNNVPMLAKETILSTLSLAGFDTNEFNINIASKNFSSEVYSL